MKDIVISARRIKTELYWLIGSFIAANLFNAYAIWQYNGQVKEIFTSFFYVLVFTFFIYAVSFIIRLLAYGLKKLIKP